MLFRSALAAKWAEFNRTYSTQWPNITRKKAPMPGADDWQNKPGKGDLVSTKPGG